MNAHMQEIINFLFKLGIQTMFKYLILKIWNQQKLALHVLLVQPDRRVEEISYLSSIDRDGAGHNSLQVTAQTDSFYRDDSLLSQYCSRVERNLEKKERKKKNLKI